MYLRKRISPFYDDLCILADEVILAEDEKGPVGSNSHAWKTEVRGPAGQVSHRPVPRVVPICVATVRLERSHSRKQKSYNS